MSLDVLEQIVTTMQHAAQNIEVRLASDSDEFAWDRYVLKHDQSTVYHRFAWSRIIESVHGHKPYFLVAMQDSRIVGLLPLARQQTILFGDTLVSLPFCPYGGPIADAADIEHQLVAFALAVCKQIGTGHLELRRLYLGATSHSDSQFVATQDLYVTFRKRLHPNHDLNLNEIPRKQRAMVRKGIKNNLRSSIEDVDAFFPLYSDNIHRHGTPGSPKIFFQSIADEFGRDCEVLIVRSSGGLALSGVLSLFFKDEVLPFYAGDILHARDFAANDFKYWEVMKRAVDRGARIFDYGRSKKGTGPFNFKSYWGFDAHQLFYEHHGLLGPIPEHNPLNPKFKMMIAVWRKLPGPLVNWLGPKVVKGLG